MRVGVNLFLGGALGASTNLQLTMLLVTLLLVVVTATGSAANTLVAGNVTTVVGSEAVLRCSFLGNTSNSSTDLQIMKKGSEELSPSR